MSTSGSMSTSGTKAREGLGRFRARPSADRGFDFPTSFVKFAPMEPL
jgi:hypothetical protein